MNPAGPVFQCGLLAACALAARARPVETLVLSYAVLGPAHYLSQISWMSGRDFDSGGRLDPWLLVACAAGLFVARENPVSPWWGAAAGLALAAAFTRGVAARALALALGAVGAALLARPGWTLWALLLPSVIHVFVFTAIFLWRGAREDGAQRAPAVLHASLGLALLAIAPADGAPLPPALKEGLEYFLPVAGTLQARLGREGWAATSGVLSFLAFAYLYHYLNWFTKAGFLGWHRVGRGRAAALTALYAASLALYAADFRAGFAAASALGLLHVLLELPLDARAAAALTGLTRVPAGGTLRP